MLTWTGTQDWTEQRLVFQTADDVEGRINFRTLRRYRDCMVRRPPPGRGHGREAAGLRAALHERDSCS